MRRKRSRRIPSMGQIDEETFRIIDRISREHSHKPFGYFAEDDLRNEIWVMCLNKLADFNTDRGQLEHFLRVSVKNALINKYKGVTKSIVCPCTRCPFFKPDALGENFKTCKKFGKVSDE